MDDLSHLPVLGLNVNVSRQSVQKFTFPEHSVHGELHLLHSDPTLVKPEGQLDTQAPSKNIPLTQVQTPPTALVPVGQFLTH